MGTTEAVIVQEAAFIYRFDVAVMHRANPRDLLPEPNTSIRIDWWMNDDSFSIEVTIQADDCDNSWYYVMPVLDHIWCELYARGLVASAARPRVVQEEHSS